MDWTNLVIQLPLVAAFIWYSLEMQKRYQTSQEKRDEAYLEALNKITERIDQHDQRCLERNMTAQKRRRSTNSSG